VVRKTVGQARVSDRLHLKRISYEGKFKSVEVKVRQRTHGDELVGDELEGGIGDGKGYQTRERKKDRH
jgi:hypothetical protein